MGHLSEPELRDKSRWNRWVLLACVALPFPVSPFVQGRDDARLLVDRAEARLSRNDALTALADFRRALRFDPQNPAASSGVARAFEAMGELDSAATVYEKLAAQIHSPQRTLAEQRLAWRNSAAACWRLGDHQRAIPPLALLHRERAGTRRTDLQLAVAYLLEGNREAARRVRDTMRKRYGRIEALWRLDAVLDLPSPGSADRSLLEAVLRLRAPRPDFEALRGEVTSALAQGCDPDLANAVLGEAALHHDLDSARQALGAIAAPNFVSLREHGLAIVALASGEAEAALAHLDHAVAHASMPVELEQVLRGQAQLARGDSAMARAALQRAVATNPLSIRGNRLLGELERGAGRLGAAAAAYAGVLAVQPGDHEATFQLGALYLRMGRMEDGRVLLLRYLETQPRGAHAPSARSLLQRPRGSR